MPAHDVHDVLASSVAGVITAAGELPPGTPWECVIVDDRSVPALKPLKSWPSQVRIVRPQRRVYCGGARNVGIEQTHYPVVVFCDADTRMAPNYLVEHAKRHLLSANLITVSLREQIPVDKPAPNRMPNGCDDTRVHTIFHPGRLGLVPVTEPTTVQALEVTGQFRAFGHGRTLGPVDLAAMVKGTNFVVSRQVAEIGFPPDFVGYGPEDGLFAAKAIARGAFVVPVLSTGVYHYEHPPRSGSYIARDAELMPNLLRQAAHLNTPADGPWRVPSESEAVAA